MTNVPQRPASAAQVQILSVVTLEHLALELAFQYKNGITTEDLLDFIRVLDEQIAETEFTQALFTLAYKLRLEE